MTEGDTSQTTPTTGIPESRLLEIEGMSYNPFSWIDSVTQGVDDIPARMNAIEQQLAALTGASADEASAILEDRDSITQETQAAINDRVTFQDDLGGIINFGNNRSMRISTVGITYYKQSDGSILKQLSW